MPAGDVGPALRVAAARALDALAAMESTPRPSGAAAINLRKRKIAVRRTSLRRLAELAKRYRVELPPAVTVQAATDAERRILVLGAVAMDKSPEAQAQALILARVLNSIAGKLKLDRGLTDEEIGLSMVATGLNALSRVWSGREVVDHMSGVVGALMATHGIEPTGEQKARGRPN